nr:MAG TPA: hypothetical protein [Microviridae sp.]
MKTCHIQNPFNVDFRGLSQSPLFFGVHHAS